MVFVQIWVSWMKIESICILSHHLSATVILHPFIWAFAFDRRDAVRLFPRVFMLCSFPSRLEERQRAEKRTREAKGHRFTPRWFDLTEDVTSTPWGDLEIYKYNGKYTQHRTAVDNSANTDDEDVESIKFSPWQYEDESTVWGSCNLFMGFGCCSRLFIDTRIDSDSSLLAFVHCIYLQFIILT